MCKVYTFKSEMINKGSQTGDPEGTLIEQAKYMTKKLNDFILDQARQSFLGLINNLTGGPEFFYLSCQQKVPTIT